jgi:hypothetical protein
VRPVLRGVVIIRHSINERAFGQCRQRRQGRTGDRLGCLSAETADERTQLAEHSTVLITQPVPGGIQDCPHAPVPTGDRRAARGQHVDVALDLRQQILGGQYSDPRRSQLDRERQPIKALTDCVDGGRVITVCGIGGKNQSSAVVKQMRCFAAR